MKKLILIGAGGHARSLIDLILSTGEWEISGIVGQKDQLNQSILGFKVYWVDDDLPKLREKYEFAVLAVGQLASFKKRISLIKKLKKYDYVIPTIVSPLAYVSNFSKMGEGCTIGHHVVVNANALLGNHCLINTQTLVEHDSIIGDFCHISTSVTINGGVIIGSETFIGSKSIIREGLTLPKGTIISAGKRIMGWPLK